MTNRVFVADHLFSPLQIHSLLLLLLLLLLLFTTHADSDRHRAELDVLERV